MGSPSEAPPNGSTTFIERIPHGQEASMNPPELIRPKPKFGNPAALGLAGFLMCNTPVSIDLMGWGSAGGETGNASASVGALFAFGGVLMMIGTVTDFIIGNTVSSVVFAVFSGFWVTFAATMVPWFAAAENYTKTSPSGATIADTASYDASFATFLIFMAVMCVIFTLCALRSNLALVLMQFLFTVAFVLLAMSFWYQADGNQKVGRDLRIAGGASAFAGGLSGWYVFIGIMFEAADFPLVLPVGDLTRGGFGLKGARGRGEEA